MDGVIILDGVEYQVVESENGFSCPNCGTVDYNLVYKSPIELEYDPDPHYEWQEVHKCTKCETFYLLYNGT